MVRVGTLIGGGCIALLAVACRNGSSSNADEWQEPGSGAASPLTAPHTYDFWVPKVFAATIRSGFTDTDYGAVAVVVNGQVRGTATAFLGNVSNGEPLYTTIGVRGVSVADTDKVSFYVMVVNGQPVSAPDYSSRLTAMDQGVDAGDPDPPSTGGSCDGDFNYKCGLNCLVAPATSGFDETGQSFCQDVSQGIDISLDFLNPDCDGTVATPSVSFTGAGLAASMKATLEEPDWTTTITSPGTESAAGCGRTSSYQTTIEIDETDGLGPPSLTCRAGTVLCDCNTPAVCTTAAQCKKACML